MRVVNKFGNVFLVIVLVILCGVGCSSAEDNIGQSIEVNKAKNIAKEGSTGDIVGNPGSAIRLKFLQSAHEALSFIEENHAEIPFDVMKMEALLAEVTIEVTDKILTDKDGSLVDALNYPSQTLIELNRKGMSEIKKDETWRVLALHEFLHLMLVDDTNYTVSLGLMKISTFDVPASNYSNNMLDVIILLDNSGSMRDDGEKVLSLMKEIILRLDEDGSDLQVTFLKQYEFGSRDLGVKYSFPFIRDRVSIDFKTLGFDSYEEYVKHYILIAWEDIDSSFGEEKFLDRLVYLQEESYSHRILRPGAEKLLVLITDEKDSSDNLVAVLPRFYPEEGKVFSKMISVVVIPKEVNPSIGENQNRSASICGKHILSEIGLNPLYVRRENPDGSISYILEGPLPSVDVIYPKIWGMVDHFGGSILNLCDDKGTLSDQIYEVFKN